ncbi:DUF2127 domain-containing protein [Aliiruegeria lutimaris]|uniref:Uncharacterized membrane protein n=1 Tax=Aliiruegeria lutimaris TaxID=571298 RepID=A0A1G9GA12_9RHOB|nr:DUF2127 domain-containing protein [Aliiruegeria lutimaris]SDK97506.1 Uncharacterized membrane protein [Aliiruegeria lutimaris]
MREDLLRDAFRLGLLLKFLHSLIEVVGGLALAFMTHDTVVRMVQVLTAGELLEDPGDMVANTLLHWAVGFGVDAQSFAAWYLMSHGAIKLVLVAAVLAERAWAYPTFIVALAGFIAYQGYRMLLHPTWFLVAITIVDVVVLALAWHEWKQRRAEMSG